MTTHHTDDAGRADDDLIGELRIAERHLGRTENKANFLALLSGGVVLGVGGALIQLKPSTPTAAIAWAGVLVFACACGLLAGAVRPSFKTPSGRPYGIVLYATLTADEIPAAVAQAHTTGDMSVRIRDVSITAVRKYAWIRRAVTVSFGGAGLLAAAILIDPLLDGLGLTPLVWEWHSRL